MVKEIKVGNTPLVELANLRKQLGLQAKIFGKIESKNPAGSVKDRVALQMILDAEEKGILHEGSVIIEPTSGNTGIGLAYIGCLKGYRVIIVMPANMSKERIDLIKKHGGEVILTEPSLGMKGAVEKAKNLLKELQNGVILDQFNNLSNVKAHYLTTGPEIFSSLKNVDIFVAGIGTGGTVSGVGKYLKEQNINVKVIGVEPASSPLLTKGVAGPHKIQGIGANFIPSILDRGVIDEVMDIENEEAFEGAKTLYQTEEIKVGISSGAALSAAIKLANKIENKDKNIVVIFPDGEDRYLSINLYE